MSVLPELREKHEDEFLEFYHSKLSEYLKKLGVDPSVYTIR
jgi:hypothetical protein